MSEGNSIKYEESIKYFRRSPPKEIDKTEQLSPISHKGSRTTQDTQASTKRKSANEYEGDRVDSFIPLLKEADESTELAMCAIHPNNLAKYFDISSPQSRLCSACVLDLVINRNFNFTMTKDGIAVLDYRA